MMKYLFLFPLLLISFGVQAYVPVSKVSLGDIFISTVEVSVPSVSSFRNQIPLEGIPSSVDGVYCTFSSEGPPSQVKAGSKWQVVEVSGYSIVPPSLNPLEAVAFLRLASETKDLELKVFCERPSTGVSDDTDWTLEDIARQIGPKLVHNLKSGEPTPAGKSPAALISSAVQFNLDIDMPAYPRSTPVIFQLGTRVNRPDTSKPWCSLESSLGYTAYKVQAGQKLSLAYVQSRFFYIQNDNAMILPFVTKIQFSTDLDHTDFALYCHSSVLVER